MKAAISSAVVATPLVTASVTAGETGFFHRVGQWMREALGGKSASSRENVSQWSRGNSQAPTELRVVARRLALGGESFRAEHVEAVMTASQQYLARPPAQRPGLQGRWKSPDRIALLPQR